jgi:hypothetical protein
VAEYIIAGEDILKEDVASPRWTFGDRITAERRFTGSYAVCLANAPLRGAYGTGDFAGMMVNKASVQHDKGDRGQLVIEYEQGPNAEPIQGQTVPITEVECEMNQIEEDVRNHPNYASLTAQNFADIVTILETAKDSDDYAAATASIETDEQAGLINELILKLERKKTHYAIFVPVITITDYYWTPPDGLTTGGYIEDPPATYFNPPTGVYLRCADTLRRSGGAWAVTRRWMGGERIDRDLYESTPPPA